MGWGKCNRWVISMRAMGRRQTTAITAALAKWLMSFRSVKTDLIVSAIATNILMLGMPVMTLQVYDRVISHKNNGTMMMLTIGVVVVVVIDLALKLARSYVMEEGSAAYEFQRSRQLMEHTVQAWADDANRIQVGDYVQAMSGIARMKEYAATRMLVTAVDVPFFLLFIAVMAYVGGWLVLAPLLLMAVYGYIIWHTGAEMLAVMAKSDALDTARYGFILESLRGIHTIKALGVEAMFARRFRMMLARANVAAARLARLNQRLGALGALFAQSVIIVVLACGAPLVVYGQLTLGGLIACVLLSGRLIQPLQHALMLWVHHQEYEQAQIRIARMEKLVTQPIGQADKPTERPPGMIRCEHLTFARHVTEPVLFDHISFVVEPGQAVALRGKEGAGRGLLLKLLAGVLRPDRGTVRIDGQDPSLFDGEQLLDHLAYLPSEAVLFRGSIMDNLTGFRPGEEERAREIARLMGLEPLIMRLPQGYDTLLEGGAAEMIPPGFCQRIAIARALRCKPRIILFNRADRSLDRDGYQHVFNLLARLKGKATIVMVSDDENLIRLCDQVYLLEDAKLKQLRSGPMGRGGRPNLSLVQREAI